MSGDSSVVVAAEGSNAITFDSNHLYHLHPSDALGMNLVSTVFDGKGFAGWRRSVLIAFSCVVQRLKPKFIESLLAFPTPTDSYSSRSGIFNAQAQSVHAKTVSFPFFYCTPGITLPISRPRLRHLPFC